MQSSSIIRELNLPAADVRLRNGNNVVEIYDPLRRKWIVLTPEEWVRQHFTAYLRDYVGVPVSMMANEIGISLNGVSCRCDTVIYSRSLEPLAIVEYKAPDVVITQKVFDQIARYNMTLKVRYLIVSNGIHHYCCRMDYDSGRCVMLKKIPSYMEM